MNETLTEKITQLALNYHKHIEKEYGCPGPECPGVKRLVAFGAVCAQAAVDEAIKIVSDARMPKS